MNSNIEMIGTFKFKFKFIAREITPELEEKMNKFANTLREKMASVAGIEPDADIHWQVMISKDDFYDIDKLLGL